MGEGGGVGKGGGEGRRGSDGWKKGGERGEKKKKFLSSMAPGGEGGEGKG